MTAITRGLLGEQFNLLRVFHLHITLINFGAEISLQYMKERKPLMDSGSRFTFAVHEEDEF